MGDLGSQGGHIAVPNQKPRDAGTPAPVPFPDTSSDGSLEHLSREAKKSPLFGNNDANKAR